MSPEKTPARSTRGGTDLDAFPKMRFWIPYLALLILFGIDEGTGISSAWSRLGSGPSIHGKPAEVFGTLLDKGLDHSAARAVRRMLASSLPQDVARDVAVERFQHWTTRTPASFQLGTVGAPVVPLLTGLLDHDKERVRQQAALALGDVAPAGLRGWLWKLWYEVPLLALIIGPAVLAFAALDLLGERFTVEGDLWLVALGIWFTGASLLTICLRRRELISRA
jgi:hypothetical protein